ncbi:MAG TPA: metal ABC transporter permease [Steroidobacteraceae bacterium]|jgi:ABC-type Mn2+/Zn2+ transport system permease subunit|nr:metal ABC transporter permease [Steroidobacteraceae bacterium]
MSTITPELGSVALSAVMAVAAGLIGSFAVMRRMVLAADPISHIALPGIGIALILRINPLWGALALLLLGAVLIWAVERRARIATEAVIGVTFAVALAVGSIITSGDELIDALLGAPATLTLREGILGIVGSLVVIGFVLRQRNALVVRLISPEIAMTAAVDVARLDLYFLMAFALTIGIGLRFLGVLLMGSLIIIPASIARRFARSLGAMLVLSASTAVLSTAAGTYVASLAGRPSGPFIVMVAGSLFFLSLLHRRDA